MKRPEYLVVIASSLSPLATDVCSSASVSSLFFIGLSGGLGVGIDAALVSLDFSDGVFFLSACIVVSLLRGGTFTASLPGDLWTETSSRVLMTDRVLALVPNRSVATEWSIFLVLFSCCTLVLGLGFINHSSRSASSAVGRSWGLALIKAETNLIASLDELMSRNWFTGDSVMPS